jgi:hypothetical protein
VIQPQEIRSTPVAATLTWYEPHLERLHEDAPFSSTARTAAA